MIRELAELSAERLNMFPSKHGVSSYYIPEALVTGRILNFNKHCKYSFGEYVQAYHDNIEKSNVQMLEKEMKKLKKNNHMLKERAIVILSLHVFVVVENIFYQIVRRKTRFQRKIGQ